MNYGKGKGWWSTKVCRRAHGCGLWRSIIERWVTYSKHLSFVVGDGSRILFWHDKWIGDNSIKTLYPELFDCSTNKEACIYDILCLLVGGNDRVWNLRFFGAFND